MSIHVLLQNAAETLRIAGVADPAREARSLLTFTLGRDTSFVIAHPEYQLTAHEFENYRSYIARRAAREPFQYITSRQEFYGLDFQVTPDVLIPRPETETLVEAAIEILNKIDEPAICEIGVGSGCISIAILRNVHNARGTGVDLSDAALAVAHRNASMHRVNDRLELQISDIFDKVAGQFDLIVSNPPYIPTDQLAALQAEVRDFEPHMALDGGNDGLNLIETIIKGSPGYLRANGHLLIEIGIDQSQSVRKFFDLTLWNEPVFVNDLQGIPRIVKARRL
jgi:release factor glutamine methyltransferase